MRLESIRMRGIGPFKNEIGLDLAGIRGLVAVVGPNGAGKSTLLECWAAGACYRETPTRGALNALALDRESYLEVQLASRAPWTIRHVVDAVSGKSESLVTGVDGRPAFESTKVRAFDAWAAKHLPPAEVLFSTMFAAQGSGGFLSMKPGDRKAVLLRVLGIEAHEKRAERHRKYAAEWQAKAETLTVRIADEQSRGGIVSHAQEELSAAREALEIAELDHANATDALAELRAAAEKARELRTAYEASVRQRAELEAGVRKIDVEVRPIATRIANNRAVIADRERILAAKARVAEITAAMQAAEVELKRCQTEAGGARKAAQAASAARHSAISRQTAAQLRADRAGMRLADREKIAKAAKSVPRLARELEAARTKLEASEALAAEMRETRLAGASDRIQALRTGLKGIASGGEDVAFTREHAVELATFTLECDDETAAKADAFPAQLAAAETDLQAARAAVANAERKLAGAERLAVRAQEMAAAEAEREQALADAAKAATDAGVNGEASAEGLEHADALEAEAERLTAELSALESERRSLTPLAAKAEPLAHAEARLAELEAQLEAIGKERVSLSERLAAVAAVQVPPPVPDVKAAEARVASLAGDVRQAHTAVAMAERSLAAAEASAATIAALEAELEVARSEAADWTRLASDFGRDGLQALEIDAAGPELTELTNDLLRNCHGSRFSVRIETQRLSSDKRMLEACQVIVLDSKSGREAEGSTFSGGERVIIGEALSLALSMMAIRLNGLEGVTLVRDETGAALDGRNAAAYVAMLRRAAEIVKAPQVLFVAHDPLLWSGADAWIEVVNGSAQLCGTPPDAAQWPDAA